MRFIRLLAASAISVTLILTLPCYSQWEGRPWAVNTNAPTWQALQAEYQPFEQLFNALVERADVVRATVATNYPRLELVQTWTVDVCAVTNVVGTNETLVASGFPLDWLGDNYNGTYTYASPGLWTGSGSSRLSSASGVYYLDDGFGIGGFRSNIGPESASWFDNIFGSQGSAVAGSTVASSPGTEVFTVTTNITTTNAFAPFAYSVDYDGTTYSGTGFPHLTYTAMEWIDQQIEDVSEYFIPTVVATSLPPSGAEVILWEEDWAAHGEFSLIGGAGVGLTTNVGIYTRSYYTRQPPVTSQWVLAEWAWGPTNWVEVVSGGETNLVAEDGWKAVGSWNTMDMRLPPGADGPLVEAYGTNGTPLAGITVTLKGSVRNDHWYNTTITTGITEVVSAGSNATNLWHLFTLDTAVTGGSGTSTGDHVVVSYKGPITLYGTRPYRLYASDLDERAAVIDSLRYAPIEHDWELLDIGAGELGNYWFPAFTNVMYADEIASSYVISDTDNLDHPPWSAVAPLPFAPPPVINSGILRRINKSELWGAYQLDRGTVPIDGGHSNTVSARAITRSAQLNYTLSFTTNNVQGDVPEGLTIINTPSAANAILDPYSAPAMIDGTADQSGPFEYIYLVSGSTTDTQSYYRVQVTSEYMPVVAGTSLYTSGRIGSSDWFGGVIPYNITPTNWPDYVDEPVTVGDIGDPTTVGFGWRPVFSSGFEEDPNAKTIPIPGFIDWGTTNGFRYRKE